MSTVQVDTARKRLTIVWFIGGGLLFTFFVVQTILGRYVDEEKEAWGWLFPNFLPTLALILGTIKLDAAAGDAAERLVSAFPYRLALGLSLFYLLVISMVIFLNPFAQMSNEERTPVQLLQVSNIFLGPLQGVVSGAMGWFFVKNK